jgi:hypothetical protein
MISLHANKWIVALCGLSAIVSIADIIFVLKSGQSHLAEPNRQLLLAGSRLLLAAGVIFIFSPRQRAIPITAALGALALAVWGALVK